MLVLAHPASVRRSSQIGFIRLFKPFKHLRCGDRPFRQMRIERARADILVFGRFRSREFLGLSLVRKCFGRPCMRSLSRSQFKRNVPSAFGLTSHDETLSRLRRWRQAETSRNSAYRPACPPEPQSKAIGFVPLGFQSLPSAPSGFVFLRPVPRQPSGLNHHRRSWCLRRYGGLAGKTSVFAEMSDRLGPNRARQARP